MDFIVIHWQQIVSLTIVGITTALLIRSRFRSNVAKHECGSCALMKISNAQQNKQ
ncbi:MAG: hypothetical protein WDA22_07640 [Bacteroidota bacterium]